MSYTYLIPQVPSHKDHIQVGATYLTIKLQIKSGSDVLDISSASAKNIIIGRPDGTLVSASATFFTDGTDGLIYMQTTASSTLNQGGTYNAQAYLVLSNFTGYSTPVSFVVYDNLPLSASATQ